MIDLQKAGLLEALLRLPYTFVMPDTLFEDEWLCLDDAEKQTLRSWMALARAHRLTQRLNEAAVLKALLHSLKPPHDVGSWQYPAVWVQAVTVSREWQVLCLWPRRCHSKTNFHDLLVILSFFIFLIICYCLS